MPLNDAGRNAALTGGLSNAITHIGLATADPGTGAAVANEVAGGSPAYARKAVAWAAAAAGLQANSGALTHDVPAATTVVAYTLHTALSGGTYLGWMPFNGLAKGFGSIDTAGVTANAIQSAAHGLANTDRVTVFSVFAESLPAGLVEGTLYFVVGSAADTFQVALTSGGAAVDITGTGELFWQRSVPETWASQGQVATPVGALVLDATAM